MTALIEVRNVSKRFGHVLAVDNCSLKVEQGTITGLIGPNGAGKTTMFNMVAGAFAPTSGTIWLNGKNVTGMAAHELFECGLSRLAIGRVERDAHPLRRGAEALGRREPVERATERAREMGQQLNS